MHSHLKVFSTNNYRKFEAYNALKTVFCFSLERWVSSLAPVEAVFGTGSKSLAVRAVGLGFG